MSGLELVGLGAVLVVLNAVVGQLPGTSPLLMLVGVSVSLIPIILGTLVMAGWIL